MTTNATTTNESLHIRVPQGVIAQLDDLAQSMDRSRNWLVSEAIEYYLNSQKWQLEMITQRVKEAEDPNTKWIPHEQVMVEHEKRLKQKLGL